MDSKSTNPTVPLRLPKNITPSDAGGWGRISGQPYGGLKDKKFPSMAKAPAELGRVRILAVVGTNDYDNLASPVNDGWFLSDFYYLHHIFKTVTEPKYQRWLTCVSPAVLVKKYHEYAHGNPREDDRRVVLDLLSLENAKDVCVVPPRDLKEIFLNTLHEWSHETAEQGQRLLVIVLAHGERELDGNMRMLIGGAGDIFRPTETNRVSLPMITRYLAPATDLTILTTACHSGAWVISPSLPNISALVAVGPEDENRSWSISTQKRVCGSRYASAISESLIKMNLPDVKIVTDTDDESDEEVIERWGPSYAALTKVVHEVMTEKFDKREGVQPMFAAKSDRWDAEWRMLSGFSETDIQARRQLLRRVPRSLAITDGESRVASASVEVGGLGQRIGYESARSFVTFVARKYLDSHPGLDTLAGSQFLHGQCRGLLQGDRPTVHDLETVARMLEYRLVDVGSLATLYKELLKTKFPDCDEFDPWKWYGERPKTVAGDIQRNVFERAFDKILRAQLFDEPGLGAGKQYLKGAKYLAALMATPMWSDYSIDEAIDTLKAYHETCGKIAETIAKLELSRHMAIRGRLNEIGKKVGKRLRSLSPRKRANRASWVE